MYSYLGGDYMPNEEVKNYFSDNLKKLLKENNMTYGELAEKIEVRNSTVSMWINGVNTPRMGALKKIADLFGVSVSYLISQDQTPVKSNDDHYYINDETRQIAQEIFENPEMRTLFKVARDIPPERLKAHIEFMKSLKAQEHGDDF
jgi:transcriptional regulator with XRE-family HTH domain